MRIGYVDNITEMLHYRALSDSHGNRDPQPSETSSPSFSVGNAFTLKPIMRLAYVHEVVLPGFGLGTAETRS